MSLPEIKINYDKKGSSLNDLYGLFFEDLNHAADGGLYAEMIQNRSFEFNRIDHPTYHSLYAWENGDGKDLVEKGLVLRVLTDDPIHPNNVNYLKVNTREKLLIRNRGFNQGLYLKEGETYRISFFAKPDLLNQKIFLELQDASGDIYTHTEVAITETKWHKYEVEVEVPQTISDGRLAVIFPAFTDVAIDMVSVFPKDTFMGRENGCRRDIAELLAAMKPKFMRFPGGCLVHDGSLNSKDRDSMYRWKNTIGPVEYRPTKRNNWGYNQSLGLGFFEYFQLCEDLNTKPLPVLPAGWDPHHQRAVPLDELGPWIQDALDLIEFANGSVDSTWGRIRAEMGHPEPFNLEYLGIGNEEVGKPFFDRYAYFHRAIREQYPEIKIINTSGPFAAGSEYERGWESAREHGSDLVDEHYYQSPDWFLANHHRYDSYDPNGPKVFLGEYASKENKWWNALIEASFMIGLERNADKVGLACYAPMLCNVDYKNWAPDLIWFNQEKSYGSTNYDVQKLFMTHQGTQNVEWEAIDFPEPECFSDEGAIGEFGIQGDWADIEVSNMVIYNKETKETTEIPNAEIAALDYLSLGSVNSDHYSISFEFTKVGGRWDKGFNFIFGKRDERNQYSWSLGGWQNQDCIIDCVKNGSHSVLTQTIWKVETDKTYHCRLEVDGRKMTTFIDDVEFNRAEDLPTVVKPIYTNVTFNEDAREYDLKLVNVKNRPFTFQLDMREIKQIDAVELSADLNAENTLENPNQVDIKEYQIDLVNDQMTVPAHTVMFLQIKR